MSLHQHTPELFVITPGDPWRINGAVTDAHSPQDALQDILERAQHFPVRVRVHTEKKTFDLLMDEQGRTTPVQDQPDAPPLDTSILPIAPQAATVMPTIAATDHDSPDDVHPPATEEPPQSRKVLPAKKVAIPALVVLLVGIGAALALSGAGEDTAASAPSRLVAEGSPPAGWKIPVGQEAVTVLGDRVVTLEKTTLRVFDAASGTPLGDEYRVEDPAKIRYLQGDTASAVDTGAGQVILLGEGDPRLTPGSLNARGTEPVILQDGSYVTADGSKQPLKKDRGVLAGTQKQVVMAGHPNKVFVGQKSMELKAAEPGAKISQWVGATHSGAVVVWSKGKDSWLTTHDLTTGTPESRENIGQEKVSVRSGVIWVGQDRYLRDDRLRRMCSDGEQLNSTIVCPDPDGDGWETADHQQKFPGVPTAASRTHAVIDGTVITLRTNQ